MLRKIGVIGSGNIGPDIALHFAKVVEPLGGRVVVQDIDPGALERGRDRIEKKIEKGVKSGAFTVEQKARMLDTLHFTEEPDDLSDAELVIEAATESLQAKKAIFGELEDRVSETTILASNSSHLPPDEIFDELEDPTRALNIHYFFPAERNPLVELVAGSQTKDELVDDLLFYYEKIGKAPIRVEGRYGFAVNPIFEGLFLGAVRCVEDGLGSVAQVDEVACRALGLGVGPFTAMNLTGGNPITLRGLAGYREHLNAWFDVPEMLHEQVQKGEPWPVAGREETVEVTDEAEEAIGRRLTGTFFGLAGEVLESGICSLADLEMGVEVGLVMRGPFEFADEIGVDEALKRIRGVAEVQDEFPIPAPFVERAESGESFDPPAVLREDRDGIAILKIRRPRRLNALSERVFAQLDRHFAALGDDDAVQGVVLTGFGKKAFVSGADVTDLAELKDREEAVEKCLHDQAILNRIEGLEKPVVCALNGLAFGGGNELAMACHARIAKPMVRLAQPEPRLGIIPGIGGSQRLPRWIGLEAAWPLLRTGRPFSAEEAAEHGFCRLTRKDVVEEAIALIRRVLDGEESLEEIPRGPIPIPDSLPEVELGHLSRVIDEILVGAIIDGAERTLEDGLEIEANAFGDTLETRDMRIGIKTFIEKGPRAKAPFVNE